MNANDRHELAIIRNLLATGNTDDTDQANRRAATILRSAPSARKVIELTLALADINPSLPFVTR